MPRLHDVVRRSWHWKGRRNRCLQLLFSYQPDYVFLIGGARAQANIGVLKAVSYHTIKYFEYYEGVEKRGSNFALEMV